jgi:hypothetical protein
MCASIYYLCEDVAYHFLNDFLAGPEGFGRKNFKIWAQCNWKASSVGFEPIT